MGVAATGLAPEYVPFADILQPRNVAAYLASQQWACLADKPFGQLWALSSKPTAELGSVILPKLEAGDYAPRINEAIAALTLILKKSTAELAEAVASVHADLFFVRVDQAMYDGTIPLRQATQLLDNIDKMIRSAALATARPLHAGKGRVPDVVKDFMAEDVRMGHTKRGSFIITVAARHDEGPEHAPAEVSSGSQQTDEDAESLEVPEVPEAVEPELSFTRRVMTTLSRSLAATKKYLEGGDDFVPLEDAVAAGVRAPLIEALSEIGDSEGLRGLNMTFEWSAAVPAPLETPEAVDFSRDDIGKLDDMSARLRREYVPQDETLVGKVTELKRPDYEDPAEQGGEIVMRADVEERMRNVRLQLPGPLYEVALRAHQSRLPIVASGSLTKQGRSWTLEGDVKVSMLELAASEPSVGSVAPEGRGTTTGR